MEQEDRVSTEVLVAQVVMRHRRRAALPLHLQRRGYRRRQVQLGYGYRGSITIDVTVPLQFELGLSLLITFRCG
jgi:hypothetical protein